MITLRQIRYFVAVAEAGSVSAAGASVGISQSGITEAIKALEEETGAVLFVRHSKGVSLTHLGHQFLRHAHSILAAVADARRTLETGSHAVSGHVNLGVTNMVAGYFLADLLARFRRVFPAVSVQVFEDDRPFIEHLLVNGELDIAIMLVSNLEDRDALETETIVRSQWRLWLPSNHKLAHADEVALADVVAEPLILLTIDEMAATAQAWWRRAGLQPRIVLNTASVEAVRSLVATGAGIAILPDMAFRHWSLEGDRLEARAVSNPLPTVDVGLAWRRGSPLSAPTETFIDLAREHARGRGR
ncbi:MAG TPA: LysR family transcriptional regulator [Vineibacter sp.]|nr:LysR family transcriptional regulator [Vineibacter sp.]